MTKLCPRGKAAAKRKFSIYPSAYANAYASKICAGKIKDPSGKKRKDWGPKKANQGLMVEKKESLGEANEGLSVNTTAGSQSGKGRLEKSGLDMDAVRKIANKFKKMKKQSSQKINKPQFQHESDLPRAMRIDTTTSAYGNAGKGRKVPEFAKYNTGGDAKIKKVIKGLNKASALHKAQAKSLQTVVGKSVGGMADYYKDLV
tara:strand:+ start:8070 stop:8675 length:606 start_codon:yes stop_codon:yes gene_type:complete